MMEARKRLVQEKRLMETELENSKKIAHRTMFEVTTTQKIESRLRHEALTKKKEKIERDVYLRRQQLADLYNSEIEFWRTEVLSKKETMEERKAALMERAYALRDAREAARKKMIQEKLDALWREGCDDARALDSKELTRFMGAERLRQIQEKENRRQAADASESVFLSEWTRQLSAIEEKDKAKEAARNKANQDTAVGLLDQIKYNEHMKDEHARKIQADDDRELAEISKALEDEAALREQMHRDAVLRGKEVLAFNNQYKEIKKQEQALEAERDALLLESALRQEREKIAAENSKAEAGYEAARQYRKYLEDLMVREKEDTSAVDEINRRESEKVWKARDDALKARQDARDYLMNLVNEGRKQQIAFKQAARIKEREADRTYASRFIEDIKAGIAADRKAADDRRKVAEDNNTKLLEQIAERERQQELAKQEIFIESKHMEHRERSHQQRLAQQAGNLRLNFPLKRPDY